MPFKESSFCRVAEKIPLLSSNNSGMASVRPAPNPTFVLKIYKPTLDLLKKVVSEDANTADPQVSFVCLFSSEVIG